MNTQMQDGLVRIFEVYRKMNPDMQAYLLGFVEGLSVAAEEQTDERAGA